jgi:hypothetical protein
MDHVSRGFDTSETRTVSRITARPPAELILGAASSSSAMTMTASGQRGWHVPKIETTSTLNEGRVDPHLSHTVPALSESIILHPPPDLSSEMLMSDDIFPPIPPSLSLGATSGGMLPPIGPTGLYSNGGTVEPGTEIVRSSRGYGPKDESSNLKTFGISAENEGRAGPVSWQDRLSGRLAQDSRGHMKWVCRRLLPRSSMLKLLLSKDSTEDRLHSCSRMQLRHFVVR